MESIGGVFPLFVVAYDDELRLEGLRDRPEPTVFGRPSTLLLSVSALCCPTVDCVANSLRTTGVRYIALFFAT